MGAKITMAGLGDLVQKAIYLGIGMADYAAERAGMTFQELRIQAQKIADEMVARGEISIEDARKYVDDLVKQAQESGPESPSTTTQSNEPRRIEIVTDEEESN